MTMTANRALISSAIALWLAGGSSAVAAETGLVLIGGGAGERERTTVGTAIESVTRSSGWSLPATPPARKDSAALLECADSKQPWDCVPAPLRAIQLLFVVGVESRTHDGAPMVVLTGKAIVSSERVVVVGERYCEPCEEGQLGEASAELANRLLRELAVRSGRTTLAVKSKPTGAQIILDGERIGATDAAFSTYPGAHMVILEKPGFLVEARQVNVREGEAAEVSMELRPSELSRQRPPGAGDRRAARPARAPGRPSRLPPALVIGGGAALLAAGAVLVALDEDVHPGGEQSPRYFDSARHGVACVIAGAALAASGAYWWMRRARARSAPAISATPTGGTVGWLGTF